MNLRLKVIYLLKFEIIGENTVIFVLLLIFKMYYTMQMNK